MFERENREKIINLVEREIQELKNVKKRLIPSQKWEARAKAKHISGQRRNRLRRNRLPNAGKTDRQARGAQKKTLQ